MQRLEVSGAVRPIYGSLGVKRLRYFMYRLKHFRVGGIEYMESHCFPSTVSTRQDKHVIYKTEA